MKIKNIFYITLTALVFISFACNKTNSSSDSTISDTASSATGALMDAFNETNTSGNGTLALNKMYIPKKFLETQTFGEKLYTFGKNLFKESSLYATVAPSISCPGGGNIYYNITPSSGWGSSTSILTIDKNFTSCAGEYGNFQLDGYAVLYWSGLSTGAINWANSGGTELQQAPIDKKITHLTTMRYVITNGLGSDLSVTVGTPQTVSDGGVGTITIPTPYKIAHTIHFLSGSSFSIDINLERKGYSSTGTLLFDHVITTPSPLTVSVDLTSTPKTRTVNGTISLQHVLAGYTATFTLTNVVFYVNNNEPVSGTINVALTGSITGSGTITYNNDVGTYDFTYTSGKGGTISGTFDL